MPDEYLTPIPVVSCAVIRDGYILLLKRAIEPYIGKWALPAGHVEPDESAERAIAREIKEETNLDAEVTYIRSIGKKLNDRLAYLAMHYVSYVSNGDVVIDEESLDYQWIPLERAALEAVDWAFTNHRDIAFELAEV
ncbi:MAG: NUDIX domain-containing protein [Deltaproteobacteria bacterium]|nr:NUDIX domain-containing protein [Deltaproteobacteria bacterium]